MNMYIKIKCDSCGDIREVQRTSEIPNNIKSLSCNWCPLCEDIADDYWEEKHHEEDIDESNPNQIELF